MSLWREAFGPRIVGQDCIVSKQLCKARANIDTNDI